MNPFSRVAALLRLLYQNGYMIRSLVAMDLRKRYVGSLLGVFWSVIHPLIQLLIYYFVFSVVFKARLGAEYEHTNYAVWLITGLLPWMMFSEVLTRSADAVREQAAVIKKMVFPSEILPLVKVAAAVVTHMIGLCLLLGLLGVLGDGVSWRALLIVPYLMAVGLLALGVAWALAASNVFLRDIGQVVGVLVNIWFFLTPIVYVQTLVPPSLQGLYALNPMIYAVDGYRAAILGRAAIDVSGLLYLGVVGLAAFAVGGVVFKRLKPQFADIL
jgi:ABC-type polysaccharide/polyol phosphate export permease